MRKLFGKGYVVYPTFPVQMDISKYGKLRWPCFAVTFRELVGYFSFFFLFYLMAAFLFLYFEIIANAFKKTHFENGVCCKEFNNEHFPFFLHIVLAQSTVCSEPSSTPGACRCHPALAVGILLLILSFCSLGGLFV